MQVVATGRNVDTLTAASAQVPSLHMIASGVDAVTDHIELARLIVTVFPAFNVLINNARVQKRLDITSPAPWENIASRFNTNLGGPIEVQEMVLPAVKTNLGCAHAFGEDLTAFSDAVIEQPWADTGEASFAQSTWQIQGFRKLPYQIFENMNTSFTKMLLAAAPH